MSSSLQDQLEQTLAEYRQKRADLQQMQEKMAEMSSTASAPRKVVTATVDTHGQITGIAFPTNAYKNMAPAELAKVVRETVRKAQTMAREQLVELMEPMMPAGMSMRGKEPGKLDIDRLFPENPEDGVFFRGLDEV
ncbi:YbaB/EbfC DNA-binding family protein [Lentzea waywayandensis]|uniref:YbaB/EbfC DNA-binding family protein n=1 Tax=Lentzea waywayandensis TaxID=84724 RepID=A0A1I6FIZ8_9PSEU|nr:YbaB/EbfC family nucleoid-associated protein [Lentzea waywayandensis]SFR29910.1 YbaB/EbfC DNA-binding family protein [Lentzea waywayandensis]